MSNQILTPTVMYALCKNRSLKQSLNEGPSIQTRKHEDQRQQSHDLLKMLKNRAIAMSSDANLQAVSGLSSITLRKAATASSHVA
jgi:hypothetical protein